MSTLEKIRWGIIGCAGIAINAVIPAIQQSQTGEVVAVASRGEDKAKQTAEKLGIARAYSSYEALLSDSDIDAVYIPLPNHLHMEWTILAARAGKHVLCEKPFALDAQQAIEMVQACEAAGVKLAEAFMYRHHSRYDRIKEIIKSGEIGELRVINGSFTFNSAEGSMDNVRFKEAMGGGSLYDVGCYPLSAARYLLEQEPEAVTVHALFSPKHDNVDMMASGMVEFRDSVALTFDCGMWADFRNTLQIVGTLGRIEVPSAFIVAPDAAGFYVTAKGERREESFPLINQYSAQVDDFGRSILTGEALRFSGKDAVQNMRVIDACLRSAKERKRVEVGVYSD